MSEREPSAEAGSYRRYVVECLAGTAICYGLVVLFPGLPFYWSIVSVLLVLDPNEGESIKLAMDRMKANVIGASVGAAAMLPFGRVGLGILSVSVVVTLVVCRAARLGKATRSALAALVIVTMTGVPTWRLGLDRVVCVMAGCLVAIAVAVAGRFVGTVCRRCR